MKNQFHIRKLHKNVLPLYRALELPTPVHQHGDKGFCQSYAHDKCAIFAYSVSRALHGSCLNYDITVVLANGSIPVHWYMSYVTNRNNKRAFIDAYGITYDERSIWARYGLEPSEDATGLVSFKLGDNSDAWEDLQKTVKILLGGMSHECESHYNDIATRFGKLMTDNLAIDEDREPMFFWSMHNEAVRYLNWLKIQPWFIARDDDSKSEMTSSIEKLIVALKRNKKPNLLWEYAVDHWKTTDLELDQGPESWQWIYSQIDSFRNARDIMCSHTNTSTK